ncbi:MAG: hypothetical protein WCK01_04905 [Candidatus Uhrbacteria bacterium]|jgi:hypothetical protein
MNLGTSSNAKARIISTTPTHRTSTLSAIGGAAHRNDSRIEYLGVQGKRMKELIARAHEENPDVASSRLDWLQKQLTSI